MRQSFSRLLPYYLRYMYPTSVFYSPSNNFTNARNFQRPLSRPSARQGCIYTHAILALTSFGNFWYSRSSKRIALPLDSLLSRARGHESVQRNGVRRRFSSKDCSQCYLTSHHSLVARANAHLNWRTTRVRLLYRLVTSRFKAVAIGARCVGRPITTAVKFKTVHSVCSLAPLLPRCRPFGAFRHSIAPTASEGRLADLCLYVT